MVAIEGAVCALHKCKGADVERDRDNTAGIALRDVEMMARDIQESHHCDVEMHMTLPTGRDTPVLFWVCAEARPRIVGRMTIRAPIRKQHRWPTGECKTLAGLMYRLLHDLDRTLDEQGHCPAEQATFAWSE